MTRKEAIQKIEFLINSYQKLIDERVDEGVLVGTNTRGTWKADTPLTQAYLEMIEALRMALNSLKVDEKYDLMMEDGNGV